MEEMDVFIKVVLAICGAVVTIDGASAVISRWLSPYKALKKKVEDKADKSEFEALKDEFERLKRYQTEDHDRLKGVEKGNNEICKCMLSLIDHELTGNSIDKLRKSKEEMQNYLIERK